MQERKVVEAKTGQETIPEIVSYRQLVTDFGARYGDSNPKALPAPMVAELTHDSTLAAKGEKDDVRLRTPKSGCDVSIAAGRSRAERKIARHAKDDTHGSRARPYCRKHA
jgi:hypothetical protein